MSKTILVVIVLGMFISCCDCDTGSHNPSGYDPSTMTERELYLTYGLEAPDQFYLKLKDQMKNNGFGIDRYCNRIKNEDPLSHFINVSARVDSIKISHASVSRSDYSNKVNNLIERLVENLEWNYNTEDPQSVDIGFGLNLKKLCERE